MKFEDTTMPFDFKYEPVKCPDSDGHEGVTHYDRWTFWTTNSICLFMICLTVSLTCIMFRRTDFFWVKRMFVMCCLQNVAALYLSFG